MEKSRGLNRMWNCNFRVRKSKGSLREKMWGFGREPRRVLNHRPRDGNTARNCARDCLEIEEEREFTRGLAGFRSQP